MVGIHYFMLRQDQISVIVHDQKKTFLLQNDGLIRHSLNNVQILASYATIITGIRRCGKSTLLLQILKNKISSAETVFYLHFEDIRLSKFETTDFERLYKEISDNAYEILFFDEIQLISGWEIFIRQLLTEGYVVFITGSNASLLSRELGTHLTGRHISTELFPFSYGEFLEFKNLERNEESLLEYMEFGGIPGYIKEEKGIRGGILNALADDILIRDIAVRHSLRDVESLRALTVYLMSNIGNTVSANKLAGSFGIKSGTTISDYFSYLTDTYLFEFLPQFSWSIKAQIRNPKKVYTIDTGFIREISSAFTENKGHVFENLIYLHLRRQKENDKLFYFKEKGECDFLVFQKGKAQQAIQVCFEIDDMNFDREYQGLLEAIRFFDLKEGVIVTRSQKDIFTEGDITIKMIPAYEFLNG